MCGAWVRMRRCSSASFGSGTARNRFSSAISSAELRNPKSEAAGASFPEKAGCEDPLMSARKRMERKADGRTIAEINFIGLQTSWGCWNGNYGAHDFKFLPARAGLRASLQYLATGLRDIPC